MKHPSGIDEQIVDKMVARRGFLHRHTSIVAADTVLVVIDLDVRTVEMDPRLLQIIEPINRVAAAVRDAGGRVAWVTTPIVAENVGIYRRLLSDAAVRAITGIEDLDGMHAGGWPAAERLPIVHGLDLEAGDVQSIKSLYSAFTHPECDLVRQLVSGGRPRTILFAGTVTNVCVESSVRGAVELGLEAIVISDAVVGHSFGAHEASLAVVFRNFGDVRPSSEVLDLLKDR